MLTLHSGGMQHINNIMYIQERLRSDMIIRARPYEFLSLAYTDCCMIGSQAFRKHQLFDPLCEPGSADLTADVDFKYLTQCVSDKGIPITGSFCFSSV